MEKPHESQPMQINNNTDKNLIGNKGCKYLSRASLDAITELKLSTNE
jgi:hypothetical protein